MPNFIKIRQTHTLTNFSLCNINRISNLKVPFHVFIWNKHCELLGVTISRCCKMLQINICLATGRLIFLTIIAPSGNLCGASCPFMGNIDESALCNEFCHPIYTYFIVWNYALLWMRRQTRNEKNLYLWVKVRSAAHPTLFKVIQILTLFQWQLFCFQID